MNLTTEQRNEMLESAKPLIKWLNDNTHPHCFIVVDQTRVELVESQAVGTTSEFLHD